jgi:hypothetical protein
MTRRPPFVKALTVDIGRVGPLGADVLALIRFVTSLEGGDDRVVIDGQVCWRASHKDIGDALGGVGRYSVGRAVRHLVEAGKLLSYDLSDDDQRKAYRIASEQPECGSAHVVSSQNAESNEASAESHEASADPQRNQCESAPSTSIEELEEEGEGGEGPAPSSVDVVQQIQTLEAELVDEVPDPEPPRYCPAHPFGTSGSCKGCAIARKNHDEWESRQRSVRVKRLFARYHYNQLVQQQRAIESKQRR